MRVQITKRADGAALLRCLRADGSVSWQKQQGHQAAFFPSHDLTHFAVESVLGTTQSFYALVRAGWDIEDTTGKGARGPLPGEAMMVEHIVGLLDVERGSGHLISGPEFRAQMAGFAAAGRFGDEALLRSLDDEALERIRARRGELLHRWRELPDGGTLELEFGAGENP